MAVPEADTRSPARRLKDEEIASEPEIKPLDLRSTAPSAAIETHLRGIRRHPLAVQGIVENGLVRPLDPGAKLPERSRAIIVASGAAG
jgi:hypothetical protein